MWLQGSDDEALASIDVLGRDALQMAAQAVGRLDGSMTEKASAEIALQQLQLLADSYAVPPRKRFPFSIGKRASASPKPDVDTLVAGLERARDTIAQGLIRIRSERARLADAEEALDKALALIRACAAAIESAAREITGEMPHRARFLRDAASARVLSREQDVLTQLAVTRQGVLALQLVSEGHEKVGQAIDRARNITISALRVAGAARNAIEGNRDLMQQAEALRHTADAAAATPRNERDVERALADAVEQVRRTVDAVEHGARPL